MSHTKEILIYKCDGVVKTRHGDVCCGWKAKYEYEGKHYCERHLPNMMGRAEVCVRAMRGIPVGREQEAIDAMRAHLEAEYKEMKRIRMPVQSPRYIGWLKLAQLFGVEIKIMNFCIISRDRIAANPKVIFSHIGSKVRWRLMLDCEQIASGLEKCIPAAKKAAAKAKREWKESNNR